METVIKYEQGLCVLYSNSQLFELSRYPKFYETLIRSCAGPQTIPLSSDAESFKE